MQEIVRDDILGRSPIWANTLKQEYNKDAKLTVAEYLQKFDKDLTVVDFKRFNLRAE